MKKLSALLCCVMAIMCTTTGCAERTFMKEADLEYQITADYKNLAEYVNARLEQDGVAPEYQKKMTEVYDEAALNGGKFILTEVISPLEQPCLCVVELESGPNSRYRVGFISYGTQNIQVDGVEMGEQEYLLIVGRNQGKNIRKIVSTQEEKQFSVEIPEEEQFLVVLPVEDAEKAWNFDPNSWRFYNAAGEDITSEIEW